MIFSRKAALRATLASITIYPILSTSSLPIWPPTRAFSEADSHGVLVFNDFILKESDAIPKLYVEQISAYKVWVCYPSEEISFECRETGGEDPRTHIESLTVRHHDETYIYEPRHGFTQTECQETLAQWQKLIRPNTTTCIYGSYVDELGSDSQRSGSSYWILDDLKSTLGKWDQ